MRRVLGILLLAATPVQASQPISESLVECGTLFDMGRRVDPEREMTRDGVVLMQARLVFLEAARVRAREEGRGDADAYVDALIPGKESKWDNKGAGYVITQDFRDWMQYCRSVAKHLGVDLSAR